MTLCLSDGLDAEIRATATEDHRSVHQTVVHALEIYLALRETADVKADPARCAPSPRHVRLSGRATSSMAPSPCTPC